MKFDFVYIVAGNYHEFIRYCQSKGVDPTYFYVQYVISIECLRNTVNPFVIFTGTCDKRKDIIKIRDLVLARTFNRRIILCPLQGSYHCRQMKYEYQKRLFKQYISELSITKFYKWLFNKIVGGSKNE